MLQHTTGNSAKLTPIHVASGCLKSIQGKDVLSLFFSVKTSVRIKRLGAFYPMATWK
jgi:hypothetical protein